MSRSILIALSLYFLSHTGCTFSFYWVNRYRVNRAILKQDYPTALQILRANMLDDPQGSEAILSARQGAKVAHLDAKNYQLAVEFYKFIVLSAGDPEERKSAQRLIAQIHFENLQDYAQSVLEYEKLLKLNHRPEEAFRYRLNLAKSHFHMNNIDQALTEIDILVEQKHAPDELFEAKVLKANTLVGAKRLLEAASLWEAILKEFPEKAKKENVALNLVVCFEEMKDFGKAIDVLQGMRKDYPHPDFLDIRIKRLKERKENQPGARGLKR